MSHAWRRTTAVLAVSMAATVPADLVVLEGAGHGFKGADAARAEQAIFEFLDAHLKP